ncbi:tumor necrosis factor receptor superfamily member 25 [Pelobates fuscus]|uniref:tumor necrosis factor receptor superfamily member 25 n=1 Tax=Pelobates fuscus TaxID=191477 RepID=UPI002FE4DCF3
MGELKVFYAEAVIHEIITKQVNKMTNTTFRHNEDEDSNEYSRKNYRIKRSDSAKCDSGLFYDSHVKHCCKKCPEGKYVKASCEAPGQDPKCEPCVLETYLAYPNYVYECRMCRHCDKVTEVLQSKCSATSDTVCVCKEGRYRDKAKLCRMCTNCRNRAIIRNCSQNEDAQCGDCLPGFYESENDCLPCPQSDQNMCGNETNPECIKICKASNPGLDSSVPYIISGILLFLLLPVGGFLIHHHKKKKTESLGNHGFTLQEKVPNLNTNCQDSSTFLQSVGCDIDGQTSSKLSQGQPASILHKGSALYDIIDSVPVRRWKEFMRVLELPDKEIELVEVEISSFRDQQYEMLRRLGHLRSTSLEHVFNALERMNLSGCAEELREKLESHA